MMKIGKKEIKLLVKVGGVLATGVGSYLAGKADSIELDELVTKKVSEEVARQLNEKAQ